MAIKTTDTKTKILDIAQSIVLDKGFGGATVDAIIKEAGVSKGAFFHHFSSKAELGYLLVERYAKADAEHLESNLDKAEGLSEDPLQQLLIFVKLFEQEMETLDEPFPGCLYASYLHQSGLFDDDINTLIRESMLKWRTRIRQKLDEVIQAYPPAIDIDLDATADMMLVIFEGAFVLSQSLKEAKVVADQLSNYHNYLKLLFKPG